MMRDVGLLYYALCTMKNLSKIGCYGYLSIWESMMSKVMDGQYRSCGVLGCSFAVSF